jgi:hypothetical protein
LVVEWISSIVIGRGGLSEYSVPSSALPVIGILLELVGCCPFLNDVGDALPVCQIWQKIKPPLECTASVTFFQPEI